MGFLRTFQRLAEDFLWTLLGFSGGLSEDFQDHILDIQTVIETQKLEGIPVIETLARVTAHLCYTIHTTHYTLHTTGTRDRHNTKRQEIVLL